MRDLGQGIRPLADVEQRSLRLGLPLIAALSRGFEIEARTGGGTTVRMRMPISSNGSAADEVGCHPCRDEMQIDIDTGELLAPVLSRVISMFATRADFSVDRLSDAVLISDALSAGARSSFGGETLRIVVVEDAGSFVVRVGPLASGDGRRLLDGLRIPQLDATSRPSPRRSGSRRARTASPRPADRPRASRPRRPAPRRSGAAWSAPA